MSRNQCQESDLYATSIAIDQKEITKKVITSTVH